MSKCGIPKSRVIILLILMTVIALSSSCSAKQNGTQENTIRETQESSTPENTIDEKPSIKVFVRYIFGNYYMNEALDIFSEKFPEVVVNKEIINSYEEYDAKLSTELMAGEGPDLILYEFFPRDLYKMSETGVFYDLDTFIKQDTEFDMENFPKVIMDSGIINDKRYFIPISFSIPVFLTTEEIMESSGMVYDKYDWSWDYLSGFISDFCAGGDNQTKRYFMNKPFYFSDCLQSSGIKYIDYIKKETYFNTPEFKNILEISKRVQNCGINIEQSSIGPMMKNGELFSVFSMDMPNPTEVLICQSRIKHYTEGTVRMIPFPTYDGSANLTAGTGGLAAINSNSKNKELVYELIKVLLSDKIQRNQTIPYTPINRNVFDSMLAEYSEYVTQEFHDYYLYSMNEKLIDDMKYITDSIGQCRIVDNFPSIGKNAYNYISGNCTLQECINKMENEVQLILNE
ncbi:MAG: extracellular solute-binding protein [Eubacteriales bacterium]|nr:extracellular solute-binding protein [Eubacteriales bacterium]